MTDPKPGQPILDDPDEPQQGAGDDTEPTGTAEPDPEED